MDEKDPFFRKITFTPSKNAAIAIINTLMRRVSIIFPIFALTNEPFAHCCGLYAAKLIQFGHILKKKCGNLTHIRIIIKKEQHEKDGTDPPACI
jgi:hypothetical protein